MKIGKNIQKYRKAKKINQSELASMIGKSQATMQKYEGDSVVPRLDVLEQLALALDVEVIDLLYGDDKPKDIPDDMPREFIQKELVINIRLKVSPDGFIDVDMD